MGEMSKGAGHVAQTSLHKKQVLLYEGRGQGQAKLLAKLLGLKEVTGCGPILMPEGMQNPPVRQDALHPHEVVAPSQGGKGDPVVGDRLTMAAQLLEDGPSLGQGASVPDVVQVVQRCTDLSQCRPRSTLSVESERERHPGLGRELHRLGSTGQRDRGSQVPVCRVQVLEVDRCQPQGALGHAGGVQLAALPGSYRRRLRHGHGLSRVNLDQTKCLMRQLEDSAPCHTEIVGPGSSQNRVPEGSFCY